MEKNKRIIEQNECGFVIKTTFTIRIGSYITGNSLVPNGVELWADPQFSKEITTGFSSEKELELFYKQLIRLGHLTFSNETPLRAKFQLTDQATILYLPLKIESVFNEANRIIDVWTGKGGAGERIKSEVLAYAIGVASDEGLASFNN